MEQAVVIKHLTDLFMQVGTRVVGEHLAHSEDDLTASQLLALRFILLHPECSLSALAEGLGISNPAATKVMDRLERKELVRRVQADDRRQIKATITNRGREVGEEHLRLQLESYTGLINSMTQAERDSLQLGLEAIVQAAVRLYPDWEQFCLHCGIGCEKDDCLLHRYRSQADSVEMRLP